jgi:hypothetical protein
MKVNIIRKILVILIFALPVISYSGCKKQAKCGCGKDVLFTLTNERAHVYFSTEGASVSFQTLNDPYSTYNFCNPTEMFANLKDSKTGDELLVSGHAYWDCNYLYQAGNSSYTSMYKIYQVQGTDMHVDMYGKK